MTKHNFKDFLAHLLSWERKGEGISLEYEKVPIFWWM